MKPFKRYHKPGKDGEFQREPGREGGKPGFHGKPRFSGERSNFGKPEFKGGGREAGPAREGGFGGKPTGFHGRREGGFRREERPRGVSQDGREGGKPNYGSGRPQDVATSFGGSAGVRQGGFDRGGFAGKPGFDGGRPGGSEGGFRGRPQGGGRDFHGSGQGGFQKGKPRFGGGKRGGREGGFGGGASSNPRGGFQKRASTRNALLAAARAGVKEAYTGKGATLIQAIRAIDDLDYGRSLVFSRLQEFFAINFPEFKLESMENYAKVAALGSRDKLTEKDLTEFVGISKAKAIMEDAKRSFGSDFTEQDEAALKELANSLISLSTARTQLEKFVEAESKRVLPNVMHLTDAMLAARLLSVAGSLDKLAGMPASTIQVIGAENALFKHLRSHGRTPPPKHGIIFQSSLIRGAPLEQRGKIARALAAKIAIAAKADAYTGNFIAAKLKESLEKRLKEIRG